MIRLDTESRVEVELMFNGRVVGKGDRYYGKKEILGRFGKFLEVIGCRLLVPLGADPSQLPNYSGAIRYAEGASDVESVGIYLNRQDRLHSPCPVDLSQMRIALNNTLIKCLSSQLFLPGHDEILRSRVEELPPFRIQHPHEITIGAKRNGREANSTAHLYFIELNGVIVSSVVMSRIDEDRVKKVAYNIDWRLFSGYKKQIVEYSPPREYRQRGLSDMIRRGSLGNDSKRGARRFATNSFMFANDVNSPNLVLRTTKIGPEFTPNCKFYIETETGDFIECDPNLKKAIKSAFSGDGNTQIIKYSGILPAQFEASIGSTFSLYMKY